MKNRKLSVNARKSQQIYDYIRTLGSVSKQDIVVGLKLSLPTVTRNLQYLTELGLLDTSRIKKNTGGRSAKAYSCLENARIAIGVYLTASYMTAVGVDLSGTVIDMVRRQIKFDFKDDGYFRQLGELIEEVKTSSGLDAKNLLGVGIAVQGLVSDDGEEVIYGLTLNFTGAKRAEMAKYIPYENRFFHDSEVGGFAEVWIDEDMQDAFYINLCNSVGGAVILGNGIYPGDSRKSGEIGHMVAEATGGKQCYCGKYGCFETVCRATNLSDYTDGNLDRFFELLENGDKKAREIWEKYLEYLSVAIHNVRMIFNRPVIIGGYVGTHIGPHMDELNRLVNARNPFGEKAEDYLLPCKYQVEASAAGAAITYIDRFFDSI